MSNQHGVDDHYFSGKLKSILDPGARCNPSEMARMLLRHGRTACSRVLQEPEFYPVAADVAVKTLDDINGEIKKIIKHISKVTPEELARSLIRLGLSSCKEVILENEFASVAKEARGQVEHALATPAPAKSKPAP